MLVQQEMKQAGNLADLASKLARTIPDESERRYFTDVLVNPS